MGEKRAYKSRKPGGGRKKLKPEYDAGKNLKEQMESAVALYEEECSLRSIADDLALNSIKVRKLLITAGVYESDVAEKVQDTFAKDIVQAGYADKCEVQLAYAIGVVQPVGVSVECFGTEHQSLDFIEAYVHDSYDLTPHGIIKRLGLLDVDYNKVSAYGHFGKAGLPWED